MRIVESITAIEKSIDSNEDLTNKQVLSDYLDSKNEELETFQRHFVMNLKTVFLEQSTTQFKKNHSLKLLKEEVSHVFQNRAKTGTYGRTGDLWQC